MSAFHRAEDIQRQKLQLAKENLEEQKRLDRKIERCMWYEYYLKPHSMVVQKNDLFFVKDNKDNKESQQQDNNNNETATAASANAAAAYVILPTTTTVGKCCGRIANATCALCTDVYKEDDIVVWNSFSNDSQQDQQEQEEQSPQEQEQSQQRRRSKSKSKRGSGCSHVFHKDCLMEWLVTKGKTHCPTCGQWYVPPQTIDDQKSDHGQSWVCAHKEMKKTELEVLEVCTVTASA